MNYGAPVQFTAGAPPRGAGVQALTTLTAQSFRGSFAWGGSPGEATIVYVPKGSGTNTVVTVGALVTMQLGAHFFAGICTDARIVDGTHGKVVEVQFKDLREFLTWDYTFCAFNMPERRLVNGVWVKRYWHIYPWNYDAYIRTFTSAPISAWAIVTAILEGPTIGCPWEFDFTGWGLFPQGLLNQPVYSFDALNGMRLDAALNTISAAGGLVFTLDPQPWWHYRLVWIRKGYGLLPLFPSNSDDRRLGVSLSGNATNIRIIGDRNKYQVLNTELTPDWLPAWQQFLVVDALAQDLYEHEKDSAGVCYNAYGSDPEHWRGAYAAKVRALEITVAEYAALRDARGSHDGSYFRDYRKYAGRSRMDMPAALYIQTLVFRAYTPAISGIINRNGNEIPLISTLIADQMLCRVTYDPVSGDMDDDPTQLSDGNGLVIVKGWQFGQDFFRLVNPERITENFFTAGRYWAAASFQIDDSSEGDRFIILDAPAFTSENLVTTIDGMTVLNAAFTLYAPAAQAALTFEAERFSYWAGTWPDVSRDRAEYISGLCAEWSGLGDVAADYRELLFANGATAAQQAAVIAASLLICQYTHLSGGYNLKWNPALGPSLGVALSSLIDRVEIRNGPDGLVEVVDLTTERQRDYFEPERDLERRTQANTLFPGQAELKQQALDYKRFAAAIKAMPKEVMDLFMRFLTGNFEDANTVHARFSTEDTIAPTGTLPAGTPVLKVPTVAAEEGSTATGTLCTWPPNVADASTYVFAGVTVRDGEDATRPFYLQHSGETVARVQGPIAANDPIGPNSDVYTAGSAYFVKAASPTCGVALMAIADTSVKLIRVRLAGGGGGDGAGGGNVWL